MDGLIKMEHLKNKTLFNNGGLNIQMEKKPTAFVTQNCLNQQSINGGVIDDGQGLRRMAIE